MEDDSLATSKKSPRIPDNPHIYHESIENPLQAYRQGVKIPPYVFVFAV
jgi:hypothetical protein